MSVFYLSLCLQKKKKKNFLLPVAYIAARRNRLRVDQILRRPITRVRLCTIIVIIIMYTLGREDRERKHTAALTYYYYTSLENGVMYSYTNVKTTFSLLMLFVHVSIIIIIGRPTTMQVVRSWSSVPSTRIPCKMIQIILSVLLFP